MKLIAEYPENAIKFERLRRTASPLKADATTLNV
jgi:hypothetical protein